MRVKENTRRVTMNRWDVFVFMVIRAGRTKGSASLWQQYADCKTKSCGSWHADPSRIFVSSFGLKFRVRPEAQLLSTPAKAPHGTFFSLYTSTLIKWRDCTCFKMNHSTFLEYISFYFYEIPAKMNKAKNLCYFYIFNLNKLNIYYFVLLFLFYFCIIFITSHNGLKNIHLPHLNGSKHVSKSTNMPVIINCHSCVTSTLQ